MTPQTKTTFQIRNSFISGNKLHIVKQMEKLNDLFRRVHKPKTNDSVLYNTMKDWDHLARNVSREYGGWFGFVKDSDYVK